MLRAIAAKKLLWRRHVARVKAMPRRTGNWGRTVSARRRPQGNYLPQTSSTLRQELRLDSLTRGLQTRWLFLDLEIGLVACAWFVDEIECHRRSL